MSTVEALKEQEAALKTRERALIDEFRETADSPEGAKLRDAVRHRMENVTAELTKLSSVICKAKEERKRERLAELSSSPDYRAAAADALRGLGEFLDPWAALIEMTNDSRRHALAVPLVPASITGLVVESRAWVSALVRLGALTEDAVPAGLRALLLEAKR